MQADFPMELFLLMGLNYVGRPRRGLAPATPTAWRPSARWPADVAAALFRAFAAAGIGRNSRVLVRKAEEAGG